MSFTINERDLTEFQPNLTAEQAQRVVNYLVAGGWEAEYSPEPSDSLRQELASDGWLGPAVEHYAYTVTLPTMKFEGQLFDLGAVVFTPGVLDLIDNSKVPAALGQLVFHPYIKRHALGDWGDIPKVGRKAGDWQANDRALEEGGRIFSVYHLNDDKFWIITEADRSVTTVLTPSEY